MVDPMLLLKKTFNLVKAPYLVWGNGLLIISIDSQNGDNYYTKNTVHDVNESIIK